MRYYHVMLILFVFRWLLYIYLLRLVSLMGFPNIEITHLLFCSHFFFFLIRRLTHLNTKNILKIHFTSLEIMTVYIGQNLEQRQWLIGKENRSMDVRHFTRIQSNLLINLLLLLLLLN